jgi:hypothetical protein
LSQYEWPLPSNKTLRTLELTEADLLQDEMVVLAKDSSEKRGKIPLWGEISQKQRSRLISIEVQDKEKITVERGHDEPINILLSDEESIAQHVLNDQVLLDISGLPHHAWAPILKVAHKKNMNLRVLYAEPQEYKLHESPASDTLFDLSEESSGLGPLPGFVQLTGPEDESKTLYIALLGFEGNRPERLAFQLDPKPKIIPVVGVPGFQLEFPGYTIACNRSFLEENESYAEIRLAKASCPFDAYQALESIRKDYVDHYLFIAPVGTKPHSLGAIWFALDNPDITEIMFDHPVRKPGRTKGIGVIHIYDFKELLCS